MTSSRAHWLWPLALAAAVTVFSGQTVPAVPMEGIIHKDKLAHLLVFGLLATAIFRGFPQHQPIRLRLYWAVGLTALFGLSDELHQGMTPTRSMDPWDWLADILGALFATALYAYVPFYRQLLEWRPFGRRKALEEAPKSRLALSNES